MIRSTFRIITVCFSLMLSLIALQACQSKSAEDYMAEEKSQRENITLQTESADDIQKKLSELLKPYQTMSELASSIPTGGDFLLPADIKFSTTYTVNHRTSSDLHNAVVVFDDRTQPPFSRLTYKHYPDFGLFEALYDGFWLMQDAPGFWSSQGVNKTYADNAAVLNWVTEKTKPIRVVAFLKTDKYTPVTFPKYDPQTTNMTAGELLDGVTLGHWKGKVAVFEINSTAHPKSIGAFKLDVSNSSLNDLRAKGKISTPCNSLVECEEKWRDVFVNDLRLNLNTEFAKKLP